jgi:hypothetical protein
LSGDAQKIYPTTKTRLTDSRADNRSWRCVSPKATKGWQIVFDFREFSKVRDLALLEPQYEHLADQSLTRSSAKIKLTFAASHVVERVRMRRVKLVTDL